MSRRLLLLALAIVCSTSLAGAQNSTAQQPASGAATTGDSGSINPQKAADIRRLLQVTGAGGLAMQMMHGMETDLKPTIESALPPGEYRSKLVDLFLEKFESKVNSDGFVALLLPIYDRHFSDEEIKQLVAFYETPIGKKAVSELPKVVAESQQVGRQWGETAGQESMNEVLEEHPDLKKALEEAEKDSSSPSVKQ